VEVRSLSRKESCVCRRLDDESEASRIVIVGRERQQGQYDCAIKLNVVMSLRLLEIENRKCTISFGTACDLAVLIGLVGCRRERVEQRCVNAHPVFPRFSGERSSDDLIGAEGESSPLTRAGRKEDVSAVWCCSDSE
jgi:hypothetical protein